MGAIILGIAMFMFLVVIHELGHFITAKKSGVHVHEFGVGIPPKVKKLWKDKAGTEYTINWIPLGGFVRLKGEDPSDEEEFLAKDSFITAKLPNKILILLGGVIVNAAFAWIAFTVAFWVGTTPITVIPDEAMRESTSYLMPSMSFAQEQGLVTLGESYDKVIVTEVVAGSFAYDLGIQENMVIQSLNGELVTPQSLPTMVSSLQEGDAVSLIVFAENVDPAGELVGTCTKTPCQLGVRIKDSEITLAPIKMPLLAAMKAGVHEMRAESKMTMSALGDLGKSLISFDQEQISGQVNNLSGPVMIVAVGKKLFYEKGWVGYLAFAGIISLALALFNILPIPALDGGRIVSVLIQAIGRFSPTKYYAIENYVNVFVFVLLMAFGLFIMYKDIILVTS